MVASSAYATYFATRYAAFGLLVDQESIAIEEIVGARIAIERGHNPKVAIVGPNRAIGCSFWLFEEMWRDCKAVRIPDVGRELNAAERKLIEETVSSPCRWVAAAKEHRQSTRLDTLPCNSVPKPFRATLFTLRKDERFVLTVINGEFVRWQ
jgi:hypothetical protein